MISEESLGYCHLQFHSTFTPFCAYYSLILQYLKGYTTRNEKQKEKF